MAGVRSSVVAAGTAAALVLALAAAAPAAVIREGDLDPAFDVDGVAVTEFGTDTSESFEDVAVQADGKAVAVGTTNFDTANVLAVARYRTDGSLDSTFGGDGRVTTTVLGRSDVA
jgi:hypothetical protein